MEINFNICRLCFIKEDNLIDIHSERGIALEIPSILSKHFVFLEIEFLKTPINGERKICESCWAKTFDFHLFYSSIFNLQQNWLKSSKSTAVTSQSTSSSSLIKYEFPDVDVLLTEKLEILDAQEFDGIDHHHSIVEETNDDLFGVGDYHSESIIIEDDKKWIKKSAPKKKRQKKVKREYDGEDYDCDDNDWNNQCNDSVDDGVERRRKKTKIPKNTSSSSPSKSVITKEALTFFDDAIIDAYMKDHQFLCEICHTHLKTFAAAKTHHRSYHKQKGYIVCCGTKYFRRDRAIDHIGRHGGGTSLTDLYTCDICQKTYARREYIKRHMESHIPSEEKSFKCTSCDSSFVSQNKLNRHISTRHYTEDDKAHTCQECGKRFLSVSYLNAHVRGVHELANAQICDFCGKVIKSKQAMTQHRLYAHSDNPKVQCAECGSWLKNGDSLRMHLARHRSKPIECEICKKVLPNKHSFNNHMIYTHGNRTYACSVCGKEYKKRFRLKEHVAQHHTGQALYTCAECNMGFQTNNMYHTHRKKFHYEDWANDRRLRGIMI